MTSLVHLDDIKYKVSSVLNSNTSQFGKRFMIDGNEETCWNSDAGEQQWTMFKFDEPVTINTLNDEEITLKIQFQGGFCCTSCLVTFKSESGDVVTMNQCYPTDSNAKQQFALQFDSKQGKLPGDFNASIMKVEFKQPTDFFGRMIVYSLDIVKQK